MRIGWNDDLLFRRQSFEELWREIPIQSVLVYLTHPDYDYLRSLLEFLKPKGGPEVVIY